MSDYIGEFFHVYPLKLDHYLEEEMYTRMNLIMDRNKLLHDINEADSSTLAELLLNYNYNHAHGMITVYSSSPVNPEGVIYATAEHNIDGIKLQK